MHDVGILPAVAVYYAAIGSYRCHILQSANYRASILTLFHTSTADAFAEHLGSSSGKTFARDCTHGERIYDH
jgi:hypothetical protein